MEKAELLKEKVVKLHRDGMKNKDIAINCNTSPANITRILKKYDRGL